MTTLPSRHVVENIYNVAIVGPSNSGKTVFFAAMWKALRSPNQSRKFYLETDPSIARSLNQSFFTISSRNSWIESTSKESIDEMPFTVRVRGDDGRVFSSCTFNYMDYAGGILTDPETGMDVDKVDSRLYDADCFLALLDGFVLHQLVSEPDGKVADRFRDIELPAILDPIRSAPEGEFVRPVQFVISKWDHLQREKISLAQIRAALMDIGDFANFVEGVVTQKGEIDIIDDPNRCVRLVPVSSVGSDFVGSWSLVDGSPVMDIKKGAKATPWNVEMPISCVLPDILAAVQAKVKAREAEERSKQYQSSGKSWWERFQIHASKFVGRIPSKWLKNLKLLEILETLLEANARRIIEKDDAPRAEFEQKKSEILAALSDELEAFQFTLLAFTQLQQKLSTQFPESELG